MGATVAKRSIISMAPFGWIHKITPSPDGGTTPGTIAELYQFDNLAEGSGIKLPIADNQSAGSDNIDITRGDGAIFRFPKFNLILDGETEEDITPAGSDSNSTGKAEVTIVTNEAPLPVTIVSWTAWLADLKLNKDELLLVTMPTGFSYDSRENQKKADGYIYVVAKITSDIEQKLGVNPSQITLVLSSNKLGETDIAATDLEAVSYTSIAWKGKGASFTPPALESGDGDVLISGDVVIKESASYEYS